MKVIQPYALMALTASLFLLSACEQIISQTTNVPPPIVNVTVQPPATPASARPVQSARPPAQASPANTSAPTPAPRVSALPEIDLPPISGTPAPDLSPPGLDKFIDSIPAPELTRDYDSRAIEMARALWVKRYNDGRQDPYHVIKMYLDAALIAPYNEQLAASLNLTVLHTQTPLLFPDYAKMDAAAIAKAKPFAIRSYYRGTSDIDNYALPDFEARIVNVVSKTSQGDFRQLSVPDVRKQAPESPRYGEKLKYLLYSQARAAEAELTLIYDKGGWKVNFWTPNVLVLFLS